MQVIVISINVADSARAMVDSPPGAPGSRVGDKLGLAHLHDCALCSSAVGDEYGGAV